MNELMEMLAEDPRTEFEDAEAFGGGPSTPAKMLDLLSRIGMAVAAGEEIPQHVADWWSFMTLSDVDACAEEALSILAVAGPPPSDLEGYLYGAYGGLSAPEFAPKSVPLAKLAWKLFKCNPLAPEFQMDLGLVPSMATL